MPAGIATSDPRATAAGAALLADGSTAVDAAVAAALVLYVVEPQSCGLGGDAFLIHVAPGSDPVARDGSGALPRSLDDAIRELRECEPLVRILGDPFISAYTIVKEAEYEVFLQVISSWEREHLLLNV